MVRTILSLALILLLQSCGTSIYYQHYETDSETMKTENNNYIYENDDLKITYNLWGENGQLQFTVINKSNDIITIDLKKSFFAVNGYAYDYFKDVQVGKSSSYVSNYAYASVYNDYNEQSSIYNSSELENSYSYISNPQKELNIPPGYSKRVQKFNLINDYYNDCDLVAFPGRNDDASKNYSKTDSPYRFANIITYRAGNEEKKIENSFYVSQIRNFRYNDYVKIEDVLECGYKSGRQYVFIYNTASNFFFQYYNLR